MHLSLAIVSCNQELFDCAVDHARRHARGHVRILGFGNGVVLRPPELQDDIIVRSVPENIGVPAAMHELWTMACAYAPSSIPPEQQIVGYIHDDVDVTEDGWDERVLKCFYDHPKCGLVGFGGATALGDPGIYHKPYEIHQLGRRNFYSNMVGAELHGERRTKEMPIVFTDGFSMIVRRSLLDKIEGWSWWPFELIHHAYDYGMACQVRRHGYEAWLVPSSVNHKGGMTATRAVHQDAAKKFGGDNAVHAAAHKWVYENFRDIYPMKVENGRWTP
jgi:GT2 family glycosyltransferase